MALSKAITGQMGIGTLIIFIATILVAAVAAGVIISTSGVLQQKSLIIASQAENRLINGIEVTNIFATGDTENKTANNFEILMRPEAGAGPINFKTTSMSFFTDTGAYAADFESPFTQTVNLTVNQAVQGNWVAFGDLDGDGYTDYVRLNTTDSALQFNLSQDGLSDDILLGHNVTSWAGQAVNFTDMVITGNGTVFGYFHISDNAATNNQIDANALRITDTFEGVCTFDKVIPEKKYCVVVLVGQDDYYLQYGETKMMYFRLKSTDVLHENDEYEFKIFPEDGRSTYILNRIPGVIYKVRLNLFP